MSRRDKDPRAQNQSAAPQAPVEQAIGGRLYGSGTEMENTFDARYDISNVDCQEGNMEHGVTGGFYEEEDQEPAPIY